MISKNRAELKTFLDQEFDHFNTEAFIALDPISIPHQFTKKQDIEIVLLTFLEFGFTLGHFQMDHDITLLIPYARQGLP
jgi:hypothetical protein